MPRTARGGKRIGKASERPGPREDCVQRARMRKKGRNDGQGSSDVRTWRLNLATDGASADGNGMGSRDGVKSHQGSSRASEARQDKRGMTLIISNIGATRQIAPGGAQRGCRWSEQTSPRPVLHSAPCTIRKPQRSAVQEGIGTKQICTLW